MSGDWQWPQAVAEGLLCLLLGTCQVIKIVLAERAKNGLLDVGNEVIGGNIAFCYVSPTRGSIGDSKDPLFLKYHAYILLHKQAFIRLDIIGRRISGGTATNDDVMDFILASRTQHRVRTSLAIWRHRSLEAGRFAVTSQQNRFFVLGSPVDVKCERGTTWLIKAIEKPKPTSKDVALCVNELEVPHLRGLQLQCTRPDTKQIVWAQSGRQLGTT